MTDVALDARLATLAGRCVGIIEQHQHANGAYPASPTFSVYGYSWLRDGAFIAEAMSRAGRHDSAERFFGWCAAVIERHRAHLESLVARHAAGDEPADSELLPTRYTLGGELGDDEWWDFQLDGYGTWVWAAVEHHRRTGWDLAPIAPALAASARYAAAFWARPCFDWWEEHSEAIHPSTLACLLAGLRAARDAGVLDGAGRAEACRAVEGIAAVLAGPALHDGALVKWLRSTEVDASAIAAATPLGAIDPQGAVAEATYRRIVTELGPDGVHRFRADTFFGGGRWVVLAGFVGWHEARTGRHDAALARLVWMADQADVEGNLPEQVTEHALHPEWIAEWVQRWGPVAQPLLWSQAMFLVLAVELGMFAGGEAC